MTAGSTLTSVARRVNVLLPLIEDGRVLSRRLERWFRGRRELPLRTF